MGYIALYRSYRPKDFDEVAGQEVIVKTLKNAIKLNKIGHAYLFSGPRGTGKTSIAKIFAKAVNCSNNKDGNPCNNCDICQGIDNGDINDVIEIDGASNNGVDEIRELRDKVKYMPNLGKYKVYIIDEVHMLTTGAFNALLKTLEEPPHHVIFILATTEVHKIPATILSRCQRFDFKNISNEDITSRLNEVIKLEKINIDKEAIEEISNSAEGGLRDALSLLDQAVSFSTNNHITADDIYSITGSVSKEELVELLKLIVNKDIVKTINKINEFAKEKEEEKIISDLILILRDILLNKAVNNNDKLKDISNILEYEKIYYYLDILTETQSNMRWTHQKRVYLEIAIIKMIEHETIHQIDLNTSINQIRQEITELKKTGIKTKVVRKTEDKIPLVDIKDIQTTLHEAEFEKKEKIERLMMNFEKTAPTHLQMTAHLLKDSELVAASVNRIILTHKDLAIANELMQPENINYVLELFNKDNHEIDAYVIIQEDDWNTVRGQYVDLLKTGQKRPKLNDYDFKIYQKIKNENNDDPQVVKLAKSYFGDLVEIKE